MKKIYAGSELAAVIFEPAEEVALVQRGLTLAMRLMGDEADRDALMSIVVEMHAPAPH